MAKAKFYAVKVGRTTGIFTSWDECETAIAGYPRAEHKSFPTKEEAEAYLSGEDIYLKQVKEDLANGYIVAYTDGSYDENAKQYSYGVCIFDLSGNEINLCSRVAYDPFASSRNIAGEIFGALTALDWAVSYGYDKIRVYHDLEHIAKWANGEFKANNDVAKYFVERLNKLFNGYISYEFIHVKGHSNNPYNDKADYLAASALKGERKIIKGANSFAVPNFNKKDIDTIIELVCEENPEAKVERKAIQGGEQAKLSIKKQSTMIKMYDNGRLLVQGKPNVAYQVVFTYISELLGENEIVKLAKQAYRMKVDAKTVEDNYCNLCPNIPITYIAGIKTLIRQAIINLNNYFEAEDYGQYAYPALRAMEGHIKYLFSKNNINIDKKGFGEKFDGDETNGFSLRKSITIPPPHNRSIEDCYNFYHQSRHKIFHFGDIIGNTDNTYMITTKEAADEIIREALRLINNTVY